MPFDGTEYRPGKPPPARPPINEKLFSIVFLVVSLSLLLLPVSLDGMVDLIRYLHP